MNTHSSGGGMKVIYLRVHTVNQGCFSCNHQAVNCKQVFLFSNSTVQTLKSTVSENSLLFVSWNHLPTKTKKCRLNFKNPLSTDLMTYLENHVHCFKWLKFHFGEPENSRLFAEFLVPIGGIIFLGL